MKIALIGYGKMGKAIEELAMRQKDKIVLKINSSNLHLLNENELQKADVAIEFSNPASAFKNIELCFKASVPVVSGTTGWLKNFEEIKQLCQKTNGSFLYASNFSIGVNIFFKLNQYLASVMQKHRDYDVLIHEIHHTQKKDAPSGTAITLAEQILQNNPNKNKWSFEKKEDENTVMVSSERKDPYPGTHTVKYISSIDEIEITHTAKTRMGFAAGALLAASFIKDKKGIFTMNDVLDI